MDNKSYHILLVEDDKYFRIGIKDILLKRGVALEADSFEEAHRILSGQKIDLAVVDIHLEGGPQGLEILKLTKEMGIPSIVLSSSDDDAITEAAYELGCDHFLVKRHYREHLETYVRQIIKNSHNGALKKFFEESFITRDEDIIRQVSQLAQMNLVGKSVFLGGETGVGKSLVGKLIHSLSFAPDAPFVHINCSEIPENLLEAELFGHKKGAFTGADKDRPGRLKQADGGVLFLDEIATMPMSMQQKLLKALDEKTFYPVGGDKMEKSNFTLISATCEDLFEKVLSKRFRKDLFFRISGLNIELKPLRERPGDIEPLARHILDKSHRRIVLRKEAMAALKSYAWPGNTRELIKTCELLSLKSSGIVKLEDLPNRILAEQGSVEHSENESYSDSEQSFPITGAQKSLISKDGLKTFVKKLEKTVVKDALAKNSGKISQTIKELQISSSAFYRIYESID